MNKYVLALVLFSNVAWSQSHTSHSHSHGHSVPETSTGKISENVKKSLLDVLKLNDILFNDLLKEDQSKVEVSAKALEAQLKKISSSELADLKKKAVSLSKISKSKSKGDNIQSYGEYLPTLIEVVKKYAPDSKYQIYYCPMVKKYWVQDERTNSTVKNVFAQDMLECGGKES